MSTHWNFTDNNDIPQTIPDDIEEILRRQDEAILLLERLRLQERYKPLPTDPVGGGRRDFRRWPTPAGVTMEVHDGMSWQLVNCMDMGIGGARVENLPDWVKGPVPVRLSAPGQGAVLVLADMMWRDAGASADISMAGVRFEFHGEEERDHWAGGLIDALLTQQALR